MKKKKDRREVAIYCDICAVTRLHVIYEQKGKWYAECCECGSTKDYKPS